jgi:hypothetical protein
MAQQRSARECPAELNVIIGPVKSTGLAVNTPSAEPQVSAKKIVSSNKSHLACPPVYVMSRDDFEIIRNIGQGTHGQRFLALNLQTESFAAMEIIEKITLDAAGCVRLFEQQRMARSLGDCAWSLGMEGSFEDSMNFYIVTVRSFHCPLVESTLKHVSHSHLVETWRSFSKSIVLASSPKSRSLPMS